MDVSGDGRGDARDDVGALTLGPRSGRPFLILLAACLAAYVAFHAVRSGLPAGWLRDSFPSVLAPLAMLSVVELTPGIRFTGRRVKRAVLAATVLVAAVWLEAVVPRLTGRATGSAGDVAALGVGFALFCGYDRAFGRPFPRRDGRAAGPL